MKDQQDPLNVLKTIVDQGGNCSKPILLNCKDCPLSHWFVNNFVCSDFIDIKLEACKKYLKKFKKCK